MNNVNVYLALLWISSHFHWHYQSAACHSFFSFGSIVFSFCGACLAHQLLVVAMAHSWNVLSFNCWALYRKEGWVEIQKKLWGLWSGRRMHMWDAMKYIHSVRNPSPLPKQGHPTYGQVTLLCIHATDGKWQREWFNSQNFIVNSHLKLLRSSLQCLCLPYIYHLHRIHLAEKICNFVDPFMRKTTALII